MLMVSIEGHGPAPAHTPAQRSRKYSRAAHLALMPLDLIKPGVLTSGHVWRPRDMLRHLKLGADSAFH